jgi:hypothetical protein
MVSHHEIVLGAPADLADSGAPAILQRSDEDFLQAVLRELRSATGRRGLRASLARPVGSVPAGTSSRAGAVTGRLLVRALKSASRVAPGGAGAKALARASVKDRAAVLRASAEGAPVLKLYQPIQRQFHLAVMEARCDTPGRPRIDPKRVEGAGLVIRRLARDKAGRQVKQGWMRAGDGVRGWVRLPGDDRARRYDPSSRRRLARPSTGQPVLDAEVVSILTTAEDAALEEHVVPMFVAPPDVCDEARSTMFYGLVPTTSSERAAGGAPRFDSEAFGPESADFRKHLAGPLRGVAESFPRPGRALTPSLADLARDDGDSERTRMQRLLLLLRQLAVEFDAFGDSVESEALMDALDRIPLALADASGEPTGETRPAGQFLADASTVLLDGESLSPAPTMPVGWPGLGANLVDDLADALSASLMRQFEALAGTPGRFDDPGARYVLRAFVRLKADAVCPARTVWSDYSDAFVIAPWYEGGGTPPVQVALPDPTDRNVLAQLRPNVAFTVPASMQDLLAGDPQDLLDGKKPAGSGLGIGWICSFNIPIITICAFIVLNIFLSLFDLFFRWMLFIKICIPFPTVEREE